MPTDLSQIGRTGLRAWGGVVAEERHPQLTGARWAKTCREIADNEAIVGAALYAIKSLLSGVKWWIKPAIEKDPEAAEVAAFVESCRGDMSGSWEDLVSEILSMLEYGWCFGELVMKVRRGPDESDGAYRSAYDDGRIGWRKVVVISQDTLDRWDLDPDGGIRGLSQRCDDGFVATVPIERALLWRTQTTRGNPEGRSLLRSLWTSYRFAKQLREVEAIGAERDLAGIPWATLPPEYMGSADPDKAALYATVKDLVQKVRLNERAGLVLPSREIGTDGKTGFDFGLLSSPGGKQTDTDKVIRRYEAREAMVLLAEFLLLGTEPNGSRSLADSKTSLFAQSLGTMLDQIAAPWNKYGIPRLMAANSIDRALWPTLMHGDVETPDLAALATAIQGFVASGALVPGPQDERRVRDLLGWEQTDVEDEAEAGGKDEAVDPAPGAVGTGEPVQNTALNGAQISTLLEIVRAVVAGEVPREAAIAIIVRSFQVPAPDAEAMLGPAGFVPDKPEPAPGPVPAEAEPKG